MAFGCAGVSLWVFIIENNHLIKVMWVKLKEYISGVKIEGAKVHWSTVPEVVKSAGLVVIAALIMSLFFFLVDALVYKVIKSILGIG